ncbi:MAG: hypothetical protein EXS16_12440 [Gemmataceae bacterium]|nr:hypothetical protein [Gemmataceae bacterium]
MAVGLFFYGLQPRWFGWDRLFKVYLLRDGIAGAYLAAQIYDEASGMVQLVKPAGIAGPLMKLWVHRLVRKRAERENRYNSLDPGSAEFLAADSKNFLLHSDDVEQVVINPNSSLWTGRANSGSVRFILRSGRQTRVILVNEQDVRQIEQALNGIFGIDRVRAE